MQEVLRKLEQVQEIDLQINAILKKKAEFPVRLSAFEAEISSSSQQFEEKKKIIDELDRNKRQQLGALELNEERAKRSQEKLEQIKTNQEFQAVSKELESLKKNSAVIKDNADKVAEELEKRQKEILSIEGVLTGAKSKQATESAKIEQETKILDTDLNRLQGLRKDAVLGIDARYLAAYDRVRMGKFGLGIVSAVGGSCKGCNMRIPPQVYNELQRGTDLHLCPSCKRILVYKDGPTGQASTESSTSV